MTDSVNMHVCGNVADFDEARPSTYDDLLTVLSEGVEKKPGYVSVYRGQANADWPLHHTLQRFVSLSMNIGDYSRIESMTIAKIEDHSDYQKYVGADQNWFKALILAQHHGCPTRLLDWTTDYIAAIHFATCSPECCGIDGVVWMVSPRALHAQLPEDVRQSLVTDAVRARLQDKNPDTFDSDLFVSRYPSFQHFDVAPTLNRSSFVFVDRPAGMRGRVAIQGGLFSVSGSPSSCMSRELLECSGVVAKRIVISPQLKSEARSKLDRSNQDECRFFPELEGVGMYVRRQFWRP